MRFSILTLHLGPDLHQDGDALQKITRLARLVAQENISCLCLQGCGQDQTARPGTGGASVREGNVARVLCAELASLGLKYDMAWALSHTTDTGRAVGPAILGHLPLLASTAGVISSSAGEEDEFRRSAVAARLAVAPGVLIDVYTASIGSGRDDPADEVARLGELVSRSAEEFSRRTPTTRRRGRPARVPQHKPSGPPVRIVFYAGDVAGGPDGPAASAFRSAGFADASEPVRTGRPDGAGSDVAVSGNGRADFVFMRPGLKPTEGSLVFTAPDHSGGPGRHGVLLAFEV